jgi:hypothetical protein
MIVRSRRGMSTYVSWILIILMAVGLSAFMLHWTRSYVQKQGEDLTTRADSTLCNDATLNADGVCQNSQTLNINITNTNNLEIYKIRLRFIDLYDNSETKTELIRLAAGDRDTYNILKQGTLSQVKVTPIVYKNKKEIACEDNSLTVEDIKQC